MLPIIRRMLFQYKIVEGIKGKLTFIVYAYIFCIALRFEIIYLAWDNQFKYFENVAQYGKMKA